MSTPTIELVAFFPPVVKEGHLILPVRAHGEKHGLRAPAGVWRAAAREILVALDGMVTPAPVIKLPPAAVAPVKPAANLPPLSAASDRQARIEAAYVDWLADETLGLTAACKRHRLDYSACLRDYAIRKLGLAQYQRLSALRGNSPHGPHKSKEAAAS